MAKLRTVRELIVKVCDFFARNPTPETLSAWAGKLNGLPVDKLDDLYLRITDTWDSWDQYGNLPKRIWSTYYALPKKVSVRPREILDPLPPGTIRAFLDKIGIGNQQRCH